MNFSEPFIRRPIATCLLMAALAFVGIAAFPFLPVAPLPQVDFPTIQVTTALAGASAETMASAVATPLERQFGQIASVTQMTSTSTLGATTIVIQFDLNRNIDAAAADVQAAITAAGRNLPLNLTTPPVYRKSNPADIAILIFGIHSDTLPITEIDNLADTLLLPPMSQVPGVAQVFIGGESKPAIHVQVDPAKLAAAGLTLEEIRGALVSSTTNAAKGTLNTPDNSFTIASNDQLTAPEQYENIVLTYRNGAAIRVRDVGHAELAPADSTVAAYTNHERGLALIVTKQPGANVIEIVDKITALMPQLQANLPPAMKIETLLDRTQTIRASVHDVEFTLALTICLVVLVILLFLRSFWATVIPALTVPLALLGSCAAMYILSFSLDNISLMALTIAVGFVVDDAIVVVENIHRHVEHGMPPFEAALKGSREIAFTVASISVSLIAVFIPLLLMGSIIGRLFREFAMTVTAAIAVSGLVSLTLAPMMCSRFMRADTGQHGHLFRIVEAGFDALIGGYRRTLDIVLRHQFITLLVFFATMALTAVMIVQIPKGFFPVEDIGVLLGFGEAAQGASPQQMMHYIEEQNEILLQDPDVRSVAMFTGSTGGYANTANTARGYVTLKPREERTASASQIINRLRPQLAKIGGANLILQPVQDITVGGRPARGSFQYTLQDSDIAELSEWSTKMLAKLRTLPILADVATDLLANAPQLTVTVNRDQAARFGISPQVIDDTLNDAYGQRQITQYFTQLNTYGVIEEILPQLQQSAASLDRIYVKSPLTGGAVPLSSLVTIDSDRVGPLQVSHQGQLPAVTLTFNLQPGAAIGDAVEAITQAAREIGMPPSVIPTFQGNAQAFQAALSSQPLLIAAALVVVYIILGILYESFIHPLTILSTLPSAGVGALLALRFGNMDLSVIGIVGIILLIGIVKKNGIMLVDFAITAERDRHMAPVDAIREACLLRFRPILMTTAAAMLAGLPLALGHGTGSELRQPLGYAMVGGLAFSQLLTLYTTPVVYLYLDRLQNWLKGDSKQPTLAPEEIRAIAAE
ncbi:MAG TPA: efflux RND transporter permease subunit [Xanthobacteraceae bacterium]